MVLCVFNHLLRFLLDAVTLAVTEVSTYSSWEERPRHPVTGALADYYYETITGKRKPCWRDPWVKNPDPAMCWYRVNEVAKMIGRTVIWVRSAIKRGPANGGLKATRTHGLGHYFIRGSDLLHFLEGTSKVAPMPEPFEQGVIKK